MAEEVGKEIPTVIYISLGAYSIIILIIATFIQLYFIRKGSSLLINIFCIFLWFTMLLIILIFPLDLFSNFIFENTEEN